MMNELIGKMKQEMGDLDKTPESQMIVEQFKRTLEYLGERAASQSGRYSGIEL